MVELGQHKCRFCGGAILPFQGFEVWALPKKVRIHSDNDYRGSKKSCTEHFRETMNYKPDGKPIIEGR
jgi:hypothetical protein